MKIPRQGERRARFQVAFRNMPAIETWTVETPAPKVLTPDDAVSMYEAGLLAVTDVISDHPPRPTVKHHFKLISRRIRRDMARKLSKRQYRTEHGLPEKKQ